MKTASIPKEFILKRLHSLSGIFLTLFLFEHLFTNSQVALFISSEGSSFVRAVNFIQNIPFLPFIEIFLLGVPFLFHGILGLIYLKDGSYPYLPKAKTAPFLPLYFQNWNYLLQRITGLLLVGFLLFHVIEMRFLHYPKKIATSGVITYQVPLETVNPPLEKLAKKMNTEIIDSGNETFIATSENFGTATFFVVLSTFQSLSSVIIYSLFVLAAVFHGVNGLWTFLINFGFTRSLRSQKLSRKGVTFIMFLLLLLGFSSIFGSFFFYKWV